jgi:hypothetical protein
LSRQPLKLLFRTLETIYMTRFPRYDHFSNVVP